MHDNPTAARAELRRSRDDAVLLGVCGGIGRALGVPAIWPRLGFVALAATLPAVALLAYGIMGVAVRRDDGRMALGGHPEDGRESGVGWLLVLVGAYLVLTAGDSLLIGARIPALLIAAAGVAAIVASATREAPPPVDPSVDPPTVSQEAPTREIEPADAPPRPEGRPGPSLLLVGVGVLVVVALLAVLGVPAAAVSYTPTAAVTGMAGTLGLLALAGVVAAIVLSGRRHAGGLLALSLVIGVMAVGLAAVADDANRLAGEQPVVEWVVHQGADLLRLDR